MKHKRKISLSQYYEEGGRYLFIASRIFDSFDEYVDSIRDMRENDLEEHRIPTIYAPRSKR